MSSGRDISSDDDWRPTCSIPTLLRRSQALADVRAFFAARGVVEVDTPVLSSTTVTDPAIDSLSIGTGATRRYLQTSPEYLMKRLIAAGAPSMARIGPVFRAGESGRLHNPEFTMIEWYRLGFELQELMDEVAALVDVIVGRGDYRRVSFTQLLREGADIDPFTSTDDALLDALHRRGVEPSSPLKRRDLIDLLMTHCIEWVGSGRVFVTEFPADQAALARVVKDAEGRDVAARFELIVDGVEVANGYDELRDADVLAQRMQTDRTARERDGRYAPDVDVRLLAALRHGLPACCGVAVGFDRLLMAALGLSRIDEALPFSFARA